MSDTDTTTPETPVAPATEAPSTPVTEQEPAPEVVAAAGAAPLEQPAPDADLPKPTEENTIDLATVSFDEVLKDLIQQTKQFAFRLIVTCGLLEQIHMRDNPPAAPSDEEAKDQAAQ
jgi:hypothetical protein